MAKSIVLTFGDLTEPRSCELHGGMATRFGTLIDPNGHKWIICAACINALWDGRQMLNMEAAEQDRQTEAVDAALGRIRDIILGEGEL
jgi:hypothetical protein